MKNPFSAFGKWRARRRTLRKLSAISGIFGIVGKLVKSGLLHWNPRSRQLLIAEPLAVVMMAQGAERWVNFLRNVYRYVVYLNLTEQWEKLISLRHNKVVAEEKRKRISLSDSEIQRIRRVVISELADDDVAIPKILPFEFYIVADMTGKNPQTALCGTYDPDTDIFDIVDWEEIRTALATMKKDT